MIDLNVKSTVRLAKLLIRDMVARDVGRILITSSIASTMPGSYQAVYDATKSFLQSFAEAFEDELRDSAVTVTSPCPGRRRRTSSTAPAWTTPASAGRKG